MIRLLRLRNFKCFEDQALSFGSLTLLTGLNGTGKSSVIQALLVLRQSYEQGLLPGGLVLNGDLTNIGTAEDALFRRAKGKEIGFDVELADGTRGAWCFAYDREGDRLQHTSRLHLIDNGIYSASIFNNKFQYLQAERIGPRRFFEMDDFVVRQQRQIGIRGEYTAHFLSLFGSDPKGQAQIGELLARAASCGIQIVAETHSDHILNGIRLAVYRGMLTPDDVQLHFFQRPAPEGKVQVVSPRIDCDGRIDRWPDGFFDQWDKALEALLEPRNRLRIEEQ